MVSIPEAAEGEAAMRAEFCLPQRNRRLAPPAGRLRPCGTEASAARPASTDLPDAGPFAAVDGGGFPCLRGSCYAGAVGRDSGEARETAVNTEGGKGSLRVALAAALLLVVQSLISAVAIGASAAAPLDLYGNPLCIAGVAGGGEGGSGVGGGHGHAKLPDCCTLGCPMVSGASGGPLPVAPWLAAPLAAPLGTAGSDYATGLSTRRHEPGNPRAPPLTA